MKICKRCGGSEFYKSGSCKCCARAAAKKWKANNQDSVRKSRSKWVEKNKEKQISCTKEWAERNKDRVREKAAIWRASNKEKMKALYTAWALNNKERRSKNSRAWRSLNKDKSRLYVQNRMERKRNGNGYLSLGLSKALYVAQKGMCACCSLPLGDDYHLDHIVPLFLGGEHSDSNIQLLRPVCNSRKGSKHPVQYMQDRGFLI
jgi:5-methylcytosine-specific restriction endonuclease McrA